MLDFYFSPCYTVFMNMFFFTGLSILISAISMPLIIKSCKKLDLYDYHDERKIHSGNISRLGGVGIFSAFSISAILYFLVSKNISILDYLPILIAMAIIFVCAVLDDLFTFPPILKLLTQLIAVSLVTFYGGHRFTQIFGFQLPKIVGIILTFGWILGATNAYNLIDGLDGFCGTLSITAIVTLGVLFFLSGNEEAGVCFILAGSVFGFLIFNWPPAKIFMGDGGAQFLGFMISTLPLYASSAVFERNKFLIMITLTAFPVFDTIAAIWRRLRDKKPLMSADRSHLHHKLLNLGYSAKSVLLLITCLQILVCVSVVVSFFLGETKGQALLIETIAFMILFFSIIHYSNRRKTKTETESNAPQEENSQN